MAKRGFKSIYQLRDEIYHQREQGVVKGSYCGFEGFYQYYSMKPQATTYVYGHPSSGKSLFWLEVSLNLTELYGFNHALFSPETGKPASIAGKLIAMFLKKPFYKEIVGCASDNEIERAMTVLNEHFHIASDEEDFRNVEDFYEYCDQIEQDTGKFLHQTVIDPYNELTNDSAGEARDIYTGKQLKYVRLNAVKKNRHNTIITHVRDIPQQKGKDANGNDIMFYPPAKPQEILNGQEFHRKGMMMVSVWRPTKGLVDQNGVPFQSNETRLIVQKYKDEHSGELGACSVYYDRSRGRYYEMIDGRERFAGLKLKNHIYTSNETPF